MNLPAFRSDARTTWALLLAGAVAAVLPDVGDAATRSVPNRAVTNQPARLSLPVPLEATALAELVAKSVAGAPDDPILVLDLRPTWAHADWHVPGAVAVSPKDALERARAAPAGVRIVFVDGDGTLAWAVAGIAANAEPHRPVWVLHGGTARYWREVELARPAATGDAPAVPSSSATGSTKRKRNAGC